MNTRIKTTTEQLAESKRRNARAKLAVLEIKFQDHGQDFLWWKLDAQGNVVDCGPFQYDTWASASSRVDNFTDLRIGEQVIYSSAHVTQMPVKYPIRSLRDLR